MKTRRLVLTALFMAITLIMSLIPNLGFIHIPPMALTICHIPVLLAAIYLGPKESTIVGAAFGVGSWLAAIMSAATPFDLLYVNPILSVIPRVIFGLLAGLLWQVLNRTIKRRFISVALTSFAGSIIHSLLVLTFLYFTIYLSNDAGLMALIEKGFIFIVISSGAAIILEASVALIVNTAIVKSSDRLLQVKPTI